MKKNIFSALKILFFLAIGIFFIWIFLRKLTPDQKREIWESFIYADYTWVLISVLIGILSHIIRAIRWRILLAPLGYKPSLSNTFFAVMTGYLANMALPRLGEVTRCGVLNKYENVPMNKSIGTVIVERSIDLVVFLILFFINLVLFFDDLNVYVRDHVYGPLGEKFTISERALFWILIFSAFLMLMVILFFIFRKRIRHLAFYQRIKEMITGLLKGLWSVTKIQKPWSFVFYSVLIWFLYFLMIYLCFFSIDETKHLGMNAALSLLIFGTIGIMLVQGGIGIYPAIIAETLVIYHIPGTIGYALGWLTWTSQTLMIVVSGIASLVLLPVYNRKTHEKT